MENFFLPAVIPRTCTLFGSSGGVNVGAGWWSSERFHNIGSERPLQLLISSIFLIFILFIFKIGACHSNNVHNSLLHSHQIGFALKRTFYFYVAYYFIVPSQLNSITIICQSKKPYFNTEILCASNRVSIALP